MATYFTDDEIRGLDPGFAEKLDVARGLVGIPFVLTETVASGGSHVANTAHARGHAVDIRCRGSRQRWLMVDALLTAGIKRIGLYSGHVHADDDSTLPQRVLWLGGDSK